MTIDNQPLTIGEVVFWDEPDGIRAGIVQEFDTQTILCKTVSERVGQKVRKRPQDLRFHSHKRQAS